MNNQSNFNPAYSTIKNIYLERDDGSGTFNILLRNPECQFERAEFVESINEIFPKGTILVRDTIDVVSFISKNGFTKIKIEYLNGTFSFHDITSTTYVTNAASDTEENFVSINISNSLYKYMQKSALLDDFPYFTPKVYRISDFVDYVAKKILTLPLNAEEVRIAQNSNISPTTNYMVYKPLNEIGDRTIAPADNTLQYLNYLSTFACGSSAGYPRYMFWTNWDNQVNFKYFEKNIEDDPSADNRVLTDNTLRFAIYDSDVPYVSLRSQENKVYRKIYFFGTDPAEQYISKNYYYVRKTPKILDSTPSTAGLSYAIESMLYDYQDEGQRYNIEFLSTGNTTGFTGGADQLTYDSHWGYYTHLSNINGKSNLTTLGNNFGTTETYYKQEMVGVSGYFQYVDDINMWKNVFDLTEVHPHYPDIKSLNDVSVSGNDTYLQKILDIKYLAHKADRLELQNRLDKFRFIEKQNFIMYVLCCMSKEEKTFFAKLKKYKVDETYGLGVTGDSIYVDSIKNSSNKPYRYSWVKLNFNSTYGITGPVGISGSSPVDGSTGYYFHNVEAWEEDHLIKSATGSDEDWAINLNERTVSTKYLPSGWVSTNVPSGFKWRPIGATDTVIGVCGDIDHIVRMHAIPVSDLLLDSKQLVHSNYIGQYLYVFTAANILDGQC